MRKLLVSTAILAIGCTTATAVETKLIVRAVSHDAKVIGDGVGGAEIRIIDVESGDVLATGLQTGSTGNTEAIMSRPHVRGEHIYDESASWSGSISIDEPTRVRIEATGPMGYPQAMNTSSKEMLLVPGEHITGDGIVLEIHGFIVDLAESTRSGEGADVVAKVTMSCGCPLQPGGMWDADRVRVVARFVRDGEPNETQLEWDGRPSMFRATVAADEGTPIEVLAVNPSRENFGRAVLGP